MSLKLTLTAMVVGSALACALLGLQAPSAGIFAGRPIEHGVFQQPEPAGVLPQQHKEATLDASDAPVVVPHCRTGPFDLLLLLSSGGTIGLVRQGPMLTNASLRYSIRTIRADGCNRAAAAHPGAD